MNSFSTKLKSEFGFSLPELLVAMIITAVLVLTIGAISSISLKQERRYRNEIQVEADAAYGFKLIRKYVREAGGFVINSNPPSPWVGYRVRLDKSGYGKKDKAFGLYQNGAKVDFVFLADAADETKRQVILSAPSGDISLSVTNPVTNTIRLQLQVIKNGITYNMETRVTRRRG